MRACLVAHPVGVRIPERPGVERRHLPARPGQPLQQDRTARAAAHDDHVQLVVVGEPPHVRAQPVVGPGAVVGQQPRRLVARHGRWLISLPSGPGRSPGRASRTSNGSRASTAGVLVAARIGRPGEADLGPGRRVGVERGARVPGPQAPHVPGGHPVPVSSASCTACTSSVCSCPGGPGEGGDEPLVGVAVEERQRLPPRLPVLRHVGVPPAVGLAGRQPGVDHGQHRHRGLVAWCPAAGRAGPAAHGLLIRGEERQRAAASRSWTAPGPR